VKNILWHIDPLLGNGREANNEATAIAMQQLCKYVTVLEQLLSSGLRATVAILFEAVSSMGSLRGYITRPTELSLGSLVTKGRIFHNMLYVRNIHLTKGQAYS
jgi:hypothetical protein